MTTKTSILGIDIGGTKILIGEVDMAGQVLHAKSYVSNTADQQTVVTTLLEALRDYQETVGIDLQTIIAAGVGVVGRVDAKNGIWLEIEPGKSDPTPLASILADVLHVPVAIENDVAAATTAEAKLGVGKETSDFIYINVGTGIAAGTMTDGKLITGGHFNAGEIGHMVVDLESEVPCGCGRTGCVERVASGLGLSEQAYAKAADYPETTLPVQTCERIPADTIFEASIQGDQLAEAITHYAAKSLAAMTMNLVRTTDPECVVFGGGVTQNDYFWQLIQSHMQPNTIRFVTNGILRTSVSSKEVGLIGASFIGQTALAIPIT
ncbi:ROK family protein [Listeria booriae]|uniref:ROK family protein n=1 Tax=Listeria booriae TaxID=1552123 RepID=UPI001629FF23|nr:ROK family protein [Listeria booriae]MBC1800659.1 ROK family protein [Listeria booriae]